MGLIINEIIVPYIRNNIKTFILYIFLVILSYSIGSLAIPRTISNFINSNMKFNNSFFKNIYKQLKNQTPIGLIYILIILAVSY